MIDNTGVLNDDNGSGEVGTGSGESSTRSGGSSRGSIGESASGIESGGSVGGYETGTGGSEGTRPTSKRRGRPRKSVDNGRHGATEGGNGGTEIPQFAGETGTGNDGNGGSGGTGTGSKRGRKAGGKKKASSVSQEEIEEYAAIFMMAHVWLANSLDDQRWALSMNEAVRIMAPALRILARYFPVGGGNSDIGLLIVALLAVYVPRIMMKPEEKTSPDHGETLDAEFKDVTPI